MRQIRRYFFKTNYFSCSMDDKRSESKVQILKLNGHTRQQHQQVTDGHIILLSESKISTNSVQFVILSDGPVVVYLSYTQAFQPSIL